MIQLSYLPDVLVPLVNAPLQSLDKLLVIQPVCEVRLLDVSVDSLLLQFLCLSLEDRVKVQFNLGNLKVFLALYKMNLQLSKIFSDVVEARRAHGLLLVS